MAQHTTRAQLATNLLAAGGIAVDSSGAAGGVDHVTAAYDGQAVVCLAGTDAAYAEWGSSAAGALRAAGARRVIVVSTGSTHAWADDSFRPGDDAVDFLGRTRAALT